MPYPSFNNLSMFAAAQVQALRQFTSYLFGWLATEHNDDGTHNAVTATSVSLADHKTSGNVTGNLVPTTTTQTLGTIDAASLGTGVIRRWAKLYIDEIDFGAGAIPLSGAAAPAWTLTAGSSNLVLAAGITSGQTLTITSGGFATVITLGGSYSVRSGVLATDGGVVIPNAQITGLYAVNGVYERTYSVRMGEWQTVAFNAANFTGSGTLTWTVAAGDIDTLKYTLVGKTMTVAFSLFTTTVAGVGTDLKIPIPGGFTSAKRAWNTIRVIDNGTDRVAVCRVDASQNTLTFYADITGGSTNWTASVDNTYILGQIVFEVS